MKVEAKYRCEQDGWVAHLSLEEARMLLEELDGLVAAVAGQKFETPYTDELITVLDERVGD